MHTLRQSRSFRAIWHNHNECDVKNECNLKRFFDYLKFWNYMQLLNNISHVIFMYRWATHVAIQENVMFYFNSTPRKSTLTERLSIKSISMHSYNIHIIIQHTYIHNKGVAGSWHAMQLQPLLSKAAIFYAQFTLEKKSPLLYFFLILK